MLAEVGVITKPMEPKKIKRERSWILVTSLGSWIMPYLKPQQIHLWILQSQKPIGIQNYGLGGAGDHCWHGNVS